MTRDAHLETHAVTAHQLPRERLLAAEAEVERTRAAFQSACKDAQHERSRADWLAARPDLVRLDELLQEYDRRDRELTHLRAAYQLALDTRVDELRQAKPFAPAPGLLDELSRLRWRHRTLAAAQDAQLPTLRTDLRLTEADRALIAARLHAARSALVPLHTLNRAAGAPPDPQQYLAADWHTHVTLLGEELFRREQQLHAQQCTHDDVLRRSAAETLAPLLTQVEQAETAVAEAVAAGDRLPEIERYLAGQVHAFVVAQTRGQRTAYEAAVRAAEATRRQCRLGFRALLASDYLAARTADYAPVEHPLFRELEATRTFFLQEWAARHLKDAPDAEQLAALGHVDGNVLVTARAGSGKTRTLVNRAAFLVRHCHVAPDDLLLLAFNKKAAEELHERLTALACPVPHVLTFHALAYALVRPAESLLYDAPDDQPALSRAVQEILDEFLRQPRFAADLRTVLLEHFRTDWDQLILAEEERTPEEELALRRALVAESLKGDYVKSFGEKVIANFLFEHDLCYRYEEVHDWDGSPYRPDFTIRHDRRRVVIEYFGLRGDREYDAQAEAKRAYWQRQSRWQFVEMEPGPLAHGQAVFEGVLRERLVACGLPCVRLSEEALWQKLRSRFVTRFAELLGTFIGRCRKTELDPATLAVQIARHTSLGAVEAGFLRLAPELFAAYLERLRVRGEEDFDGLLQQAIRAVENGQTEFTRRQNRGDLARLRFVLVDEFQDCTPLFYRLLQAARGRYPHLRLFCVGDDWQAINAFAGSDLRYFERFEEQHAPATRLPLTTNYRSAAGIVHAGNALMAGRGVPARPGKACAGQVLVADLAEFRPDLLERHRYPGNVLTPALARILRRILSGTGTLAILARKARAPHFESRDGTLASACAEWVAGLPKPLRARVHSWTTHKYKGLQADTVILIDVVATHYPLVHPDWVFLRVLGDNLDKLTEAERRLFYVACTRAAQTLIVVTDTARPSPFLRDLAGHGTRLDWREYPASTERYWLVQVGSQAGLGSWPTVSLRHELRAAGFAFKDGDWPHWERFFPADDLPRVDDVVNLLREQPWAGRGQGLEVRIRDQQDTVRTFRVAGGVFVS